MLKALGKGEWKLDGMEILSFAEMMKWFSSLQRAIEIELAAEEKQAAEQQRLNDPNKPLEPKPVEEPIKPIAPKVSEDIISSKAPSKVKQGTKNTKDK
jgi:hypothetical protein